VKVDCAYRLDFLVDEVVLEVKSVAGVDPIHIAQVMTYMKLRKYSSNCSL